MSGGQFVSAKDILFALSVILFIEAKDIGQATIKLTLMISDFEAP